MFIFKEIQCILISFQQIPGHFSILGAFLISLAVISSGVKKVVGNFQEEHWMRNNKLFKFMYE